MKTVTVVVPVYNEGAAVAAHLVEIADYLFLHGQAYAFDYLVVDDGSTDETPEVLRAFARHRPSVQIVTHERNRGLGQALRTAFERAQGCYTVVLDADLSYSPDIAMQLIEALEREDADLALASAYMRGGSVVNVPWMRRILSREANRLLSLAAKGKYATFTCMVRAYRTAFLRSLSFASDGMEANAQILFAALRAQGRIVEIPARLQWNSQRRSSCRVPVRRLAKQTRATMRIAFAFRPALWLAVPGLFPGLLPLVVTVMLLLHVKPQTLAIGSAATIAIQYTSLAIFAGQLTAFFGRAFFHSSNAKTQRALH
jgi:dolichol-phosphate mannosyltransferase